MKPPGPFSYLVCMRYLIQDVIKQRLYNATSLNIYEDAGWGWSLCFDSGSRSFVVVFMDNKCSIEVRGLEADKCNREYLFYYADPDLFDKLDEVMRC